MTEPIEFVHSLLKSLEFIGAFSIFYAGFTADIVTNLLLNNSVIYATIIEIKKESMYFYFFR